MYIHNTLSENPVNPNIVSGADFDKNYSRFEGDPDELMRIHNEIQSLGKLVYDLKIKKVKLESEKKSIVFVDNWTPLITQRNNTLFF